MAKFLNLLKLRGFTSPSDAAVEISASTDSASASRLRIDAGGKLTWGDGTNAGDTNLYRSVANTLKTDDYLIAQGGLTIESYQVTTAGASTGTVLKFDGTKFAPASSGGSTVAALDDLTDVVITSPSKYQILNYDGTNWVNTEASVTTYVRNAEATTLQPGEVVYLFGQQGDRASVKRASNSGDITSATTLGVVASAIPTASDGPVVTQGYLSGLNLAGYTPGGIMYLGSTAGTMTQTKPYAPNHLVYVGVCVRANAGSGIMYVRAQNGYELDEIHNVDNTTTPPVSGDILKYNGSLWVNGKAVLGTNTTGNYVDSLVAGTGVTITNNSGAGATPTVSVDSTVALRADTHYIGTTAVALNRTSANLALTGISSITLPGATSGTVQLVPTAAVGTGTVLTIPATTGTIVTTGDTGTVTSTMIADGTIVNADINASAAIALSKLASGTAGRVVLANASGVPTYTAISGDITINSSGVATISANSVALGTDTTGDYVASINSGTGVSVSGASGAGSLPTISIGQAVGTTDSPSFAGLTVGGSVPAFYAGIGTNRVGLGTNMPSNFAQVTIKSTSTSYAPLVLQNASGQTASSQEWQNSMGSVLAYVSSTGDIFSYSSVTGASVSGYTITRGAVLASDADLTLRYTASGTPSQDANINVNRGTSPAVAIRWNETTDKWQFTNDGTTYKDLGSGGITVSDTAPSTPATGDLWYESDTGSTYVYYDSYWIEIGGAAAYNPITGTIQAKGDLLAGTASQAIARLAVGTNGTRLVADSTTATGLAWASDTQNTVIDAKGDLLVGLADNTVGKLTVGTNGQYLVADSSQTTGVGWVSQNTRNLLYNGAMQVAQRSLSVAGITAGGYNTADRWNIQLTTLGTWTNTVTAGVAGTDDLIFQNGFKNYFKMLLASGAESPVGGTNDVCIVEQLLEGQDLQLLGKGTSSAKQLTISFWVKSGTTGTYIARLRDNDNNRSVSQSYTISAANTWEYKTITFPSDTTGAFDNDNNLSLRVQFWLAAGSAFTSGTLATTWATTVDANIAVGQVNLAAANNNYWQITGVQLNVGPVAAPFEFKSYERELRECQRYYWRKTSAVNYQAIGFGMADSTTGAQITIPYPVPMRDAPSSFDWNALRLCDYQNVVSPTSWAIVGYRTSPTVATMAVYTAGSLVQYRPYILEGNNTSTAFFGMSAEL